MGGGGRSFDVKVTEFRKEFSSYILGFRVWFFCCFSCFLVVCVVWLFIRNLVKKSGYVGRVLALGI